MSDSQKDDRTTERPPEVKDVNPGTAFEELIAENGAVCGDCLRRVGEWVPVPELTGEQHGDLMTGVTVVDHDRDRGPGDRPDREYRRLLPADDRVAAEAPESGDDPTHGERPICERCGAAWTRQPPTSVSRPRSVDGLRDLAENVSDTLQECGIAHDPHVLRGTAVELKTNSYQSGATDAECLDRAVEAAIRAAKPAPPAD